MEKTFFYKNNGFFQYICFQNKEWSCVASGRGGGLSLSMQQDSKLSSYVSCSIKVHLYCATCSGWNLVWSKIKNTDYLMHYNTNLYIDIYCKLLF